MKLSNLTSSQDQCRTEPSRSPTRYSYPVYFWHGPGHPCLKGFIVAQDNKIAIAAFIGRIGDV
jgi:hypothetical protein